MSVCFFFTSHSVILLGAYKLARVRGSLWEHWDEQIARKWEQCLPKVMYLFCVQKNHAPCKDLALRSSQTIDERQKRLNIEDLGLAICLLLLSPPFSRLHAPNPQCSDAAVNATQ